MADTVALLGSYWTLAVGAEPHTAHEYSTVGFRERVAAAARAGFTGIGIWHADLEHTLRTLSLEDMRRILDDHGIRHVELEFLNDWFLTGEPKRQSDIRKRLLFEAAEALSARAVKVGDFIRQPCPMPHLIESFAALCAEAESHGTKIGYELMPFCIIDSLPLALELVEGAGARNGGIFFDLWHLVKLKIPYADIARFPQRHIVGIELNDGYIKKSLADMALETTQHRQRGGEAEFAVRGSVEHMLAAGWSGPWGIKV